MTTKRIAYTRAEDDGVSVIIPAPEAQNKGETEDDFIERCRVVGVPGDATNVVVIEAADQPIRAFRNAWRQTGAQAPRTDMSLARAIKTDQIRVERDTRLALEDTAYMRADETGDTAEKARIAVKKQALRDLPATIQPLLSAAATPKTLEAWQPVWPT